MNKRWRLMQLPDTAQHLADEMFRRAGKLSAAACSALLCVSMAEAADTYPNRAIRMIVPFVPGGAADIVARLVGARLNETFGQAVVIDTRPGGGMVVGTDILAKANPDGYTVGMLATSLALNAGLLSKLPYDSVKDFAPITLTIDTPLIFLVPSALPVKSMRDLIAMAQSKPNAIAFASAGQGTSGHLANELLMYRAQFRMLHVPYKGAGQALIDLIGGQVQTLCTSTLPALPHVRSGVLRGLAVTTAQRSRAAPEIPTVAEAAQLPGYRASTWYAMFAPARTPQAIIHKLHGASVQALKVQSVVDQLVAQGADPIGSTPDELRQHLQSEIGTWTKIIKVAGIKPQ